jgi:uncharacterized iron-regulated membrane protein
MIHLPKNETKLMVAVHGWSGILLGLVLYAVILTGTAAVFAEEIGIWSAGHVSTSSAFERPIGRTVERLGQQTPSKYHEGVDLFEVGDHELGAFFHRHETDSDGTFVSRGIYYQVDRNGRIVDRQAGTGEEVFGPRNDDALSHFLVDTHVRLHIPNPWGLLLTGVLGLAMLVAAISGLMIHRHLFKDIFTLRRKANPVLFNRDRHSVAGTWSLPFAFILAFTGSFFSFFGTVGVPIVAMAAFGGDVQALNDAVFGNPGKPDPRPAATRGLDRITSDAIGRTGEIPTFITIENFGRADAKVTTFHPPEEGGVVPISLLYAGADGRFEQVKPLIGATPSAGGTLAAIMSPLHFGNFAGLLSKAVWFGLGFAMCYVTLTGLRLWVVRRASEARSLGWLDRLVTIVGLGLPFALLCTAAAFFLTASSGQALFWTPAGFLIASAAVILGGFLMRDREKFGPLLEGAVGLLLLGLPLLRLFMGGPGWGEAIRAGQPIITAVDCALLLAGGWVIARSASQWTRGESGQSAVLQAAE